MILLKLKRKEEKNEKSVDVINMIYKQTKLQHNPQDHPLSALNYIMEPVTIAAITGGLIAHIGFPAKDNVVENL